MNTRACRFLVALLAVGCAADDNSVHRMPTTSDSAGVRIVVNTAPLWAEGEGWRLLEEPVVSIGAENGPPHLAFGNAHSPVRLSDGRIVVADMMTNLMHFYDADGQYLRSAGGKGQGPGEFSQLYRMRRIDGDSLMALSPPSETSIFTPDGEYVRRFRLAPIPGRGNLWWLGRLSDNTLVVRSLQREGTRELAPPRDPKPGVEYPTVERPDRPPMYRDTLQHFLFDMEGELIDTIGKLPGQWLGEQMPYPPNAAYTFRGDAFYHSPGDVVEIREFRSTPGDVPRLTRITRAPGLRDPALTAEDREAFFEMERARYRMLKERGMNVDLASLERRFRDMPFPERVPLHGTRMHADPAGNLWLQAARIRPGPNPEPFQWMVFDADGRWLGVVQTPARFTISEIGEDYILGVARDELDVQYVRLYRLAKPGAPARD